MSIRGVLAIFVKTPEYSPVKTRLATGIGLRNALQFYNHSLVATTALAQQVKSELHNLDVMWAVAEAEGMKSTRWKKFNTVFQKEGSLGQRLHTVYEELLQRYDFVAFMGADSPHLASDELMQALRLIEKIRQDGFVIGETDDGGFYFFGGGKTLPKEVWLSVEYSSEHTAKQLESQLAQFGCVEKIQKTFDIDTIEDLRSLSRCRIRLLPEQAALIEWTRSVNEI